MVCQGEEHYDLWTVYGAVWPETDCEYTHYQDIVSVSSITYALMV